jgi:arginyl-tRNA synthetase
MPEHIPDAAAEVLARNALARLSLDFDHVPEQLRDVFMDRAREDLTAAAPHLDPSWRSQAAYRHAVAECINDLTNFAHTYTDPAVHQVLRRARDLLRARRDGTPPPGLTDVPVDGEVL